MAKVVIPKWWSNLPEWFKKNDWLVQNQDTLFVKRLLNVISDIQTDKTIKSPSDKPMKATRKCLMGNISIDATKFQYSEALKQLESLSTSDRNFADEVMEKFKIENQDYLPFITSDLTKLKKAIGQNVVVVYKELLGKKRSDSGKLYSVGSSVIILKFSGHSEIPLRTENCKILKIYDSQDRVIYRS